MTGKVRTREYLLDKARSGKPFTGETQEDMVATMFSLAESRKTGSGASAVVPGARPGAAPGPAAPAVPSLPPTWDSINGKPEEFPPAHHVHAFPQDSYKVKVNAADPAPGFLDDKMDDATDVQFTPKGGKLNSIVYQLTGFEMSLSSVVTHFHWSSQTSGMGGRGISPGRVFIDGVETDVWAVQDAFGPIYYSADLWKTSIKDLSLAESLTDEDGVNVGVTFPVIRFLFMAGVGKYAWVCGSDHDRIHYALHEAGNYNSNGTLKSSAWARITAPTLPYGVADIGVSGNVACMVGKHGHIIRTEDWLTFTVVHSDGMILGGIDANRFGRWITIRRDYGRLFVSHDNGLTWAGTDVIVDGVPSFNLHPAGSVAAGVGFWLITGQSAYSYSIDGLHWHTRTNTLGEFYGTGFDGAQFFATNPDPDSSSRIFKLSLSYIPCHRPFVAEEGATVMNGLCLPDLPNADGLSTDGFGNVIAGGGSGTKSRLIADATPAGGDNIPLLFAKTAAAIESVRVVLAGGVSSSALFDIYLSANRSAGAAGTRLTPISIGVSDTSGGVLVELASPAIPAGSYLYALVHSAAVADFLEFHISYKGGD